MIWILAIVALVVAAFSYLSISIEKDLEDHYGDE